MGQRQEWISVSLLLGSRSGCEWFEMDGRKGRIRVGRLADVFTSLCIFSPWLRDV